MFSYLRDYRRICEHLREALRRSDCALHAATFMTNHVHLVVTPPDGDAISAFVKGFAQRYAHYRNQSKDASGKVWEQRYECHPILDERQFGVVTVYAEANPVRAGMVDDGAAYPWSTFALHAGEPDRCAIPIELWTPSAWYLGLGSDWAARAARYRELAELYRRERIEPERIERIEAFEAAVRARDRHRVRRPDGLRADEEPAWEWEPSDDSDGFGQSGS